MRDGRAGTWAGGCVGRRPEGNIDINLAKRPQRGRVAPTTNGIV